MAVFAFLSAISFIQTQQYVAERTGVWLWVGLGILFAALTIWQLIIVNRDAGSGNRDQ